MTNIIDQRLEKLIAMGCLQPDDEKFEFFKSTVLPCVIFEWITPQGINSHSFRCPFDSCAVLISNSQILERHLREKHFEEIPNGVFGNRNKFSCNTCGTKFTRYEHFKRHNNGLKHLKTVVSKGMKLFI